VGLGLYLGILASVWGGLRRVRREAARYSGPGALQATAMVSGIECSLAVFVVGSVFLSLEVFELPYFLMLLSAQLVLLTCPEPKTHALPGTRARLAASPGVA